MARAAEDALRKRNYALAADYAQRAVKAAPQDSRLWFLLGYTSRLAGKYQASLDAYHRGLQSQPSSAEGLSGEAQTYAKLGNTDEAKRLLMQVIAAHPDRINDVLIAGELDIQTGDLQRGLSLLQRAEASKPSAHSELLMAMAYMRLKEPAKAKDLLERARRRDPKNVEIFRAVANFQRESKDYSAAIATLKSSPRATPEVLGDLAYTYELAGQTKESAATYVRAANADPRNIRMQLSAAQSQIATGDIAKGKSFLARAAALDADHYRLHAIRANLAKIEHRDADAIQEYNLALAHLPQGGKVPEGELFPIDLRLNLAELYKQAGDEANARQQMAMAEKEISGIHVEGPAQAEFLRVRASVKQAFNDPAGAEADLKQAMAIDPANTNIVLQYANLLWKTDRKDQARNIYVGVLNKDPKNRYALEAMGYLARDAGDAKTAEQYFNRLAAAYPDDYVAYLALGDMFTASRDFGRANANYQKAFTRSPKNSTVVANAANAAIEARNFNLARVWVDRATGPMNDDPRVVRERERYLFHTGKYLESARLGYKVLQKLPKDRNASVYLGYDLYNLGRYDDVLALANKYENILPKEPNFPLLAGHVHKQAGLLDEAVDDYSRAQERDPKMVEAYVNRGYVENDLQQADQAAQDFHNALQLNPNNGTAHLGLAFADLQLRHGKLSLQEADAAQKLMGESGATHLAKATAYRQLRALTKAEREYRAALKSAPDDEKLHLALADTLYHMRRYTQSLGVLSDTLRLAPEDTAQIYAQMAHAHAQLHQREQTLKYVAAAEREDNQSSAILLNTGDALLTLGDKKAAMDRFARALEAPDADRVEARLAIAKLFVRESKWDDARQQVGLAFAEARVGEASPVTADELIEAANIFLAIQDFKLATRYFAKARDAGAGEDSAVLGIANADVAQGNDVDAAKELATLGDPAGYADNYDYNLTMGNIYRHRRDNFHALGAFARANDLAGESDDVAERELLEVSGEEGMRINNHVGILSDISSAPIFEDPTIYEIDARLFQVTNPKLLPAPRSTTETKLTEGFNLYEKGLPPVHGFFQVRDARGQISLPFESLILNRRTRDYNLNSGITPSFRLGHSYVTLDAGLQYTIRRDSFNRESALDVNQNLFRQYLYLNTTPFGSWLAVNGSAYHEASGFTERKLNSRDLGARLEFVLGRPWGKTAVITGYSVRDLLFNPLVREFFTTSTYAGLERKFGTKVKVKALGEYIRSWRVSDLSFSQAQAMRPAGEIEFRPNNRWLVDGSLAYGRGEGFHSYDNVQTGFFISYSKPLHTSLQDAGGRVPVEYPLRFSVGLEQQTFSNYAGRGQTFLRPTVRLTLF
jgi:tetratricopeptide (TPR) repeat protein